MTIDRQADCMSTPTIAVDKPVWMMGFREASPSKQGLKRFTRYVYPGNAAAIALAKAQGFVVEGIKVRADSGGDSA